MREMRFKGKRIDNGEWVEGDLVHSVYQINDVCVGRYGSGVGMHQVDETAICQYTGMVDKHGRKIWENDIVKMTFGTGEITNGIVVYREDCRFLVYEVGKGHYGFTSNSVEVIGNVFDNPEFLGGGME